MAPRAKQSAMGSKPPVQEAKLPGQGKTPVKKNPPVQETKQSAQGKSPKKKNSPVQEAKPPAQGSTPVKKKSPVHPSPDTAEDPELPVPPGTPVEDPARYCAGGLHPVYLGDGLGPNGRYRVFYKLGHDDISTRWLCMDQWTDTAVSVRIPAASASATEQDAADPPATNENLFWLTGPNGRHRCRVGALPGPSLASLLRRRDGGFRPNAATRRDWCRQLVTGLRARHTGEGPRDNTGDHGDDDAVCFRPEAVYQRLDATRLTAPALTALLGTPRLAHLRAFAKPPPGVAAARTARPHYLVVAVDLAPLSARYGIGRLVAPRRQPFPTATAEGVAATENHPHHVPPERLCGVAGFALAGGVWGLASVLFLVRTGTPLLGAGPTTPREAVRWLRTAFGPFPLALRDDVAAVLGADAVTDGDHDEEPEAGPATNAKGYRLLRELLLRGHPKSGEREGKNGGKDEVVEGLEQGEGGVSVGRKRKAEDPAEEGEPSAQRSEKKQKVMAAGGRGRMKEGEADLLADLLSRMLRNDPWDRISIEQVSAHKWLGYGTKKVTEKK